MDLNHTSDMNATDIYGLTAPPATEWFERKPSLHERYRSCCLGVFNEIIHSTLIKSKIWELFNESTTPYGEPEWQLINEFCNDSSHVIVEDCNVGVHAMQELNPLTLPIYGYISPCLGIFTLITNVLVCIVLLKRHMRNPTNILLVAMAISDLLTGVIPIPVFLHTYTLGNYEEWSTCTYAILKRCLSLNLPTICHIASIWLTVALAVQRYLCVCHSNKAKKFCTVSNIIKVIVAIYVVAFLSQVSRFFDTKYIELEIPSIIEPWKKVPGCREVDADFVRRYENLYQQTYWWFRVICVHMIPCTVLVILNALLICTMRAAQARRQLLLKQNRNSESKRLKETNSTTFMLVAVVGLFLLVEFPLAIILILYILQSSFFEHSLKLTNIFQVASLIINVCILLSYPFNFVIYCGMSRQFRDTFKRLFIPGSGPLERSNSHYVSVATENGNNKHCITDETEC